MSLEQANQTNIYFNTLRNTSELLSTNWLTDNTFHEYFDLLNDTYLVKKTNVQILKSVFNHAIKSLNDFQELLNPLNLQK